MGENDEDQDARPEIYADNGWVSVKVKGQEGDDMDDAVEATKDLVDYMSENAQEHRDTSDEGFR